MDGNGRWAEEQSRSRKEGHIAGAKAFIQSVKDFIELDLEYLTVFAFSTENNNREKTEVDGILEVVNFYLKQEIMPLLYRYPFEVRFIGDKKGLPMELVETMDNLTKINETCLKTVIIALNYGGINEVVRACNKIDGEITEEKLLDSAKAIAAMSANVGSISDFVGKEITGDLPPIVAIPTTAGTGSET